MSTTGDIRPRACDRSIRAQRKFTHPNGICAHLAAEGEIVMLAI